jgi:adenylate cyclase
MKKYLTHWLTAFITLAVLTFFHFNNGSIVEILRLKQFDLLQQTDKPVLSKDIGIVTIDEKSIEKYGQWPWNREAIADIIWKLRRDGAGIIVLPILFSESDRLGGDLALVEAIKDNGVIIAQVGSVQANKNAVSRGVAKIGDPIPYLFEWPGMLGPIPLLGENAEGVGVLNTPSEIDGVVRRVPLIMRVGNETYPAIAIEVIRVATGNPSYQIKANNAGVEKIRVPGYPIISTDPNGQIWLRWNKQFETISASNDDFTSLQGKTVIIGTTAEGIGGIIATPNGPQYNYMPSAVLLQTVIDGDQIQRPFWAFLVELIASFTLGLLIILISIRLPYYVVGLTIVGVSAGLVYSSLYAWQNYLYLLDITMPLIVFVITGFHAVFNRFVKEFTLKQQIKKQFEHYLAPAMVKKLQKNPDLLKLGGDTRELTILFSDIRGFTPISEQYKTDPQGLTKLINRYMTPMTDIVMRNEGTVDKYIGDALMAFWNAPLDVPRQKELAIKTANEMFVALAQLNKELESEGMLPIKIGVGINTGSVVVGNMGSNQRFDYSVLGDAVNLAARLEGQSKEYGLTLLVGEDSITSEYAFIELDRIAVKGKTDPATIYTALFGNYAVNYIEEHDKYLQLYRDAKWDLAINQISKVKTIAPDQLHKYYDVMSGRAQELKRKGTKTWDGIFIATSK